MSNSPAVDEHEHRKFTSAEQHEVRNIIRRLQQSLGTLPNYISSEGMSITLAKAVMNGTEFDLARLGKILAVPTESEAQIEKRHGETRRLNERVHELEKLLGKDFSPGAVQPALRHMTEQIRGWWALEGLGGVYDPEFSESGLVVSLGCRIDRIRPPLGNIDGMNRQELLKLCVDQFRGRGFVFINDGENGLEDCPESRLALKGLLRERLPSVYVDKFDSTETRHGSRLNHVKILIRDLAQIYELPVPPEDAEEID